MAKSRPPQTKKKLGGPRLGEGGPRQAKADAVTEVQERLSGSGAVLLTEYRGMTVGELAELRASLREAGTDYKVYKNSLATIAARKAGIDGLVEFLEGPTAFAFITGDVVVAAKRLADFAKRVPTLVLKGGLLDGKILTAKDAAGLSALDSREVTLAKIAGMFQSPIQQLANLFAAPLTQLGSLLAQLKDKKAVAEPEPAAQPEQTMTEPAGEQPADPGPTLEAAAAPAEQPAAEQPNSEAPATEQPDAEAPVAEQAAPETPAEPPATEETTEG